MPYTKKAELGCYPYVYMLLKVLGEGVNIILGLCNYNENMHHITMV
jgi:hypothetical protein